MIVGEAIADADHPVNPNDIRSGIHQPRPAFGRCQHRSRRDCCCNCQKNSCRPHDHLRQHHWVRWLVGYSCDCNWSRRTSRRANDLGNQSSTAPHRHLKHKHVVLYFKRSPHNFVGLYSNQVAEYLSRLPTNEVPVTFEVTKDFGRVRAFNEIQIGELKTWDGDHSYGYGGVSSHSAPSPWP